ncbi:hypothetical protein LJR290_005889 [Variovorax sp. LjRoot290]|uniref:hypothetical protein n=1 Tax=Variovorax sp. LjRoot290 TaxID=3342316 RepID=UPI003ECD5F3B
MKHERIAATCDCEIGHCSKTTTEKKIVRGVDAAVKTIYSSLHSRSWPQESTYYFFDHTTQAGTIVKARLTLTNIRPASGRAFVRVSFCGDLGMLPSKLHQRPNPMHATQANLWAGAYEDQVPPGGGSA